MADVAAQQAEVPESGPFVTETMAELYLQQGHREEALRVYRALAEQRPADATLREKLNRLEAELAPVQVAMDRQALAAADVPSVGPTIRELLAAIALRRPGYRAELTRGNGAAHVGAAMSSASNPAGPDAPNADTLGPAFGFGSPSDYDESAAVALAHAFSANGQSANEPLAGAPARPAETALSLDTVFKGGEGPAPSNFSFDQFFSQRATAEHPSTGSPDASAVESPAEVAKFTEWLEGLKRR